jgi:hypothetical protein
VVRPKGAQTGGAPDVRHPKAADPGPRPVGNQIASVPGAIFKTPILDTLQPKDADGNGAGRQLPVLTPDQTVFWFASLVVFGEPATVEGAIDPNTNNPSLRGLGPAFNGDSCGTCHAFPAIGGSSPLINPQVALATAQGARNVVPSFIALQGPVREARFIAATGDGLPGGAVRALYSIQGRSDAPPGCTLAQPNFFNQLKRRNVVFRIPTPTFGVGYIENTPDDALRASFDSTESRRSRLGIGGHFNTNGNDQTITRFGWKAQNKSLLLFSGEAANVEMGLTNEIFSSERSTGSACDVHELPEDTANIVPQAVLGVTKAGDGASLVSSVTVASTAPAPRCAYRLQRAPIPRRMRSSAISVTCPKGRSRIC